MQPDPEIVERYRRWVAPKTVPQPAKQAPTEPVVQPLYRRMVMTEMNADVRLQHPMLHRLLTHRRRDWM